MAIRPGASTKALTRRWLLLIALLSSCAPDRGADGSGQPARDLSAEVSAVVDRYVAAFTARDTARIRSLLVADGRLTWLENGAVAYRTTDELLRGLAAFPPETTMRTELGELTVVPVGDEAAHAWAPFTTSIGEGDQGFSFGGVLSFVWERSDTGWILVGGHTSSPEG